MGTLLQVLGALLLSASVLLHLDSQEQIVRVFHKKFRASISTLQYFFLLIWIAIGGYVFWDSIKFGADKARACALGSGCPDSRFPEICNNPETCWRYITLWDEWAPWFYLVFFLVGGVVLWALQQDVRDSFKIGEPTLYEIWAWKLSQLPVEKSLAIYGLAITFVGMAIQ